MLLRCRNYRDKIEMLCELPLATKPLLVDLVVIKLDDGVVIDDPIGRNFRRHNLLEFKSPSDKLSIDDFYKVLGYAALYKSLGERKDAIRSDDITMTLVREGVPRELIKHLRDRGIEVTESSPGVYNVAEQPLMFKTTIVAYGKMPPSDAVWLSALTSKMKESQARTLVDQMQAAVDEDSTLRDAVDSLFYVALEENSDLFSRIRGDEKMVKWFNDMIAEGEQRGEARGIALGEARGIALGEARGIALGRSDGIIRMGRDLGLSSSKIISSLISILGISEESAERMLQESNA